MESANAVALDPRTTRTSPTEEQWNEDKAHIKHLYIDQNLALKDVMSIMQRDRGFSASMKAYKSHLSKWRFAKNNKEQDMRKIASEIANKRSTQRAQAFIIDGRVVTVKEVARYWKRRGVQSIEDAAPSQPDDRHGLTYTPVRTHYTGPSALVAGQESSCLGSHGDNTQPASIRSPPSSLSPPESATELVIKMVSVYYAGCCETNLWYTCTFGRFRTRRPVLDAATVLDRFVGFWTVGLDDARAGSFAACRHALSQACQKIPRLVQAEHPSTIRAFLEMVVEYSRCGFYGMAALVLRHLVGVAPRHHPLAVLSRQILAVEPGSAEDMALSALDCGTDALEKQCGDYHYSVVRCRVALIKARSTHLGFESVAVLSNRLLKEFLHSNRFLVEGYLNTAEALLENLTSLRGFGEAEAMIRDMMAQARALSPERERSWTVKCVNFLSKLQFEQGKYELAECNCRYCITIREEDFKSSDSQILECKIRLSEWLSSWGSLDKALAIKTSIAAALEELE